MNQTETRPAALESELSPEELALLNGLTAEERESLTHEPGQRPDRKGIPTFHVVF